MAYQLLLQNSHPDCTQGAVQVNIMVLNNGFNYANKGTCKLLTKLVNLRPSLHSEKVRGVLKTS